MTRQHGRILRSTYASAVVIAAASAAGGAVGPTCPIADSLYAKHHSRVVQMNQHVARNLDTIITVLEDDITDDRESSAADAC